MGEPCVSIRIECCSPDYEELVARVAEAREGSSFRVGDRVFAVVDYRSPRLRLSREPLSLTLPESRVFRIPDSIDDTECPQLIPLIKFGTICCYAMQRHNVTPQTCIALDCDSNAFHLMARVLRRVTKNVCAGNAQDFDLRIRCRGGDLEFEAGGARERVDLSSSNVLDVFGLENVKKVMEYVAECDLRADVIHRPAPARLPSSKSRFFEVIDVS